MGENKTSHVDLRVKPVYGLFKSKVIADEEQCEATELKHNTTGGVLAAAIVYAITRDITFPVPNKLIVLCVVTQARCETRCRDKGRQKQNFHLCGVHVWYE